MPDELLLHGYHGPGSGQGGAADPVTPPAAMPGGGPEGEPEALEPFMEVWGPWLEHLVLQGLEEDKQEGPSHLRVLRWVYGNIVSSQVRTCTHRSTRMLRAKSLLCQIYATFLPHFCCAVCAMRG